MELKDLKGIAIHCNTQKEAIKCCEVARKLEWEWNGGFSYADNIFWNKKNSNIYYLFYEGFFVSKFFCENNNYTIKTAQWFLDNFNLTNKNMETNGKKGTIAEMYACANDELKEVLKKKFSKEELGIEKKIPTTWEEFCENNPLRKEEYFIDIDSGIRKIVFVDDDDQREEDEDKNILPSKESAEAHLAFMQLEQLRDCYRDGWVPDWRDEEEDKYIIDISNDNISTGSYTFSQRFLSFQSKKLRDKFYENFIDLIEQAKELL